MRKWNDEERRAIVRKLASPDPATVAEAASLLAYEARALAAAGQDPGEILVPSVTIDVREATRIARQGKGET